MCYSCRGWPRHTRLLHSKLWLGFVDPQQELEKRVGEKNGAHEKKWRGRPMGKKRRCEIYLVTNVLVPPIIIKVGLRRRDCCWT